MSVTGLAKPTLAGWLSEPMTRDQACQVSMGELTVLDKAAMAAQAEAVGQAVSTAQAKEGAKRAFKSAGSILVLLLL